jgi:hypothetical protein
LVQPSVACAATGMIWFIRSVRLDLLVGSGQPVHTSGHILLRLFWFGVVRPMVGVRSYVRVAVGLRALGTLLCFVAGRSVARGSVARRTIARRTSGTFGGLAAGLLPSRLLGLLTFGLLTFGLLTFGLLTFGLFTFRLPTVGLPTFGLLTVKSRTLGPLCLRLGAPRSLAGGDDLWIGCGDLSTSGHTRHRRDGA